MKAAVQQLRDPVAAGVLIGIVCGAAALVAAGALLAQGDVQPVKALIAVWLAILPVLGVGALLGWVGGVLTAALARSHSTVQAPRTVEERMKRRSRNALVFMVKWPEPGRAKTRLCPPLSFAEAADLARAFLLDTLSEAADREADLWLAYAPREARDAFRSLVGVSVGLIEADTDDLGGALSRAQTAALDLGYRRVALVAADVPHLDGARYTEAFAALHQTDVVIGPSSDGGYYLLATETRTPELFTGIAWSTATVCQATVAAAERAGRRVATIAPCDDVDTPADLVWLLETLNDRSAALHTRAVLERIATPSRTSAAD